MAYDQNNRFGVLADQDTMDDLPTGHRAKNFKNNAAAEIREHAAYPQNHHNGAVNVALQDIVKLNLHNTVTCEKAGRNSKAPVDTAKESSREEDDNLEKGIQQGGKQGNKAVATKTTTTTDTALPTPITTRSAHPVDERTPNPPTKVSGKPSHRRHRDNSADTASHPTPTPTRERFIFTSTKTYSHARSLFSISSQPNHSSSLRWSEVATLLASPPVNCKVTPSRNGGSSVTIVRPKRNGLDKKSVVVHRPHGGVTAKCEREVLENMARCLGSGFGWRRGDFVMDGEEVDEEGDENDD